MLKKYTLRKLKVNSCIFTTCKRTFSNFAKFDYEDALNVKSLFSEEETMVFMFE